MATEDFGSLWTYYMGADVTPEEWAAPGWDIARVMREVPRRDIIMLPGSEADVAEEIAAGLTKLGLLPMTTTITLTTNNAASRYGVPVLVIGKRAYGPTDVTL